ncbi:MAG TPA: HEXXH motif-containing putative peptide modification protein [Polyangiaceae bacterium]|jgi:HEXXH motif-containing protein|nr:HEXXH motif-containing putative peptide modification protein [Polyangiaceae bacterium]
MLTAKETAALSCPGERRDEIVARLRASHQRDYVWGLLVRSGETLARDAPALAALLVQSRDDVRSFASAIPVQQAALVAAACGKEDDAVWAAAQVGLALRHAGVHAPWSARFRTPRRVRYAGWVSPPLEELDVAHLEELDAARSGDVSVRGWVRLAALTVRERSLAIVPRELRDICPIDADRWKTADSVPDCVAAFTESIDVVARGAPEYLDWIADGVHTLVPVEPPPGVSVSGSRQNVDGVVIIGLPVDSVSLGELLVHEASHQMLHLVEAAATISNGYDDRKYYSPFARAERDIRRMLVGFHAFANIALYYQRVGGHIARAWHAQWSPALEACHHALVASPGLTSHGRALFEPVASSIRL